MIGHPLGCKSPPEGRAMGKKLRYFLIQANRTLFFLGKWLVFGIDNAYLEFNN
jgi:hypothetical protein